MSIYKFSDKDVIKNTVVSHPKQKFVFYDGEIYKSAQFPSSSISISSLIYKDGSLTGFNTLTQGQYNESVYGATLTGSSYTVFDKNPTVNLYASGYSTTSSMELLGREYSILSVHNSMSSSYGNKFTQRLCNIDISSIFYGSKIKPGSVSLKMYQTGTLLAELTDSGYNGELIQTYTIDGFSGSQEVAGSVYYDYGIFALTGTWDLNETIIEGSSYINWTHFAYDNGKTSGQYEDYSFELSFEGTQKTPVVSLFCHAPKGELNFSNNPTYIKYGQEQEAFTSSFQYKEPDEILLKNVSPIEYSTPTGSYERCVYITKINVYDKNKNLVGVAKLAKPIRKLERDSYTFKLKVDI